jgi:methionyl-tRNA formyltransferase
VGMPDMALICLAKLIAEHVNIVACVPPSKDTSTFQLYCDFVNRMKIPLVPYQKNLKEPDFINTIKALNCDIAVVCSYNKLFPKEFLQTTKDGFINVHPALLPKYRGGNPYSHVIINGEKETGVTLHFMDEHFDTGDIVSQNKIEILNNDTMGTIFNRLNFLAADMLYKFLIKYENNEKIERIPQPKGDFIKAPSIHEDSQDVMIDWNKSAIEINRFIRALNPFINACTSYRGNYIKVHTAYIENRDSGFKPGTIVSIDKDLGVATKRGVLHITIVQASSYFIGSAADFIRLSRCKIGEMLE